MLTSVIPSVIKHGSPVVRVGLRVVVNGTTRREAKDFEKILFLTILEQQSLAVYSDVLITLEEAANHIHSHILGTLSVDRSNKVNHDLHNTVHFYLICESWYIR